MEYVNDRIIKLSFPIRGEVREFIQLYGPQQGNKENDQEKFLEVVEGLIRKNKVWDMNAQIGKKRIGMEELVGSYG